MAKAKAKADATREQAAGRASCDALISGAGAAVLQAHKDLQPGGYGKGRYGRGLSDPQTQKLLKTAADEIADKVRGVPVVASSNGRAAWLLTGTSCAFVCS